MPGIVGIVGRGVPDEHQRLITTMIGTMMHERSYVSRTYFAPDLGVYAGWVAHAGSAAEHQSTLGSAGQPVLLISGECFASSSEGAAAPLKSYEQHSDGFAATLDGSFSGLLIDPARELAFLFNDRFGSERIYYHEREEAVYFASEAKALLAVLPQVRQFDEEGVAQFLRYGCTLPDRTLFRGVRVMSPGSIWSLNSRVPATKRLYFRPAMWRDLPDLTVGQFREGLAEALRNSVRACIASDAPVGISITGGLDTRMIMACLPQTRHSPICYTFAGVDGETLDVRIGRRVAQTCGLEHRTLRIGPDFLTDFGQFVDRTTFITDGCVGALGAHEIYFNSLAAQIAPVRVTGNFGSEILRGMTTFKPINLSQDLLEPGVRAQIQKLRTNEPEREGNPALFAAFHEIPSTHFGIPAAARSQLPFRAPFLSNAIVELAVRSPPLERSSPAACASVIERYNSVLSEIPTDRGVLPKSSAHSRPLSRLFAEVTFKLDYWHKEGLPPALASFEPILRLLSRTGLLGLHKFLPYRGWFKQELSGYVRSVVSDTSTRRMPWWNASSLDRILADHQSGRRNHIQEIHAILTLDAVQRCLMGNATAAPGASRENRSERYANSHS